MKSDFALAELDYIDQLIESVPEELGKTLLENPPRLVYRMICLKVVEEIVENGLEYLCVSALASGHAERAEICATGEYLPRRHISMLW